MEKMSGYYLTIDVGTTAVKVCAVTENFKILSCVKTEYQLHTEGTRVTMPAEDYWNYAKQGIRAITAEFGKERITGIAVTTQGETMIPVDEAGIPLCDAVVWLDGRAEEQARKIGQLVSQKEFYVKTGVPECNELCPVSKLLWFLEEEPELYVRAKYFLLLEDYMIFKLTGKAVTEKSLLCTTGYFDLIEDEIWESLLCRLGLDPEKIPPALDCGKVVAPVLEDVAAELGLGREVMVVTGGMDQVCGALGAGNSRPGMLTETTGTALCIGKTITKAPVNPEYPIPVYRHYNKELQLLLPVCMTAGMALKWFKDTFCEKEVEEASRTDRSVYDLLNDLARDAEPLAGGIIMLPYLAGSIQPYQAPGFRGGFLGVGLNSRKCDFVRALMEGVSFMLKENLQLLNRLGGGECDHMISMGGGAGSGIWCQIKADVTGLEVRTLEESETASVGAAMLCALGLGKSDSLTEWNNTCSVKKIYLPQKAELEKYKAGYERYSRYLRKIIEEDA